jgi:hypothetical protein
MADDSIIIPVLTDTDEAKKSLDRFQKESDKTFKSIEKSAGDVTGAFKKMGIQVLGVVASFAAIKTAIGEAVEEEQSIRALNLAMASTGEYSEQAAAGMAEFATSLGDVSGVDDDVIRSMLTLAKSFGITNDEAKKLVDAAADLSAVTGVDVETAVRQLGGTLDGSVGKIGLLGAEFRNLTSDQLKNGEAITLLNSRYGDAAETIGETFGASLSRLKNSFDDALKEVGKTIIGDESIKQLINTLIEGLKTIAPAISFVTKIIIEVVATAVEGLGYIVTAAAMAGEALGDALGLDSVREGAVKTQQMFFKVSESINKTRFSMGETDKSGDKFSATLDKINKSAIKAKTSVSNTGAEFEKLKAEGDAFKKSIFESFGDEIAKETEKANNQINKTIELEKKGAITAEESAKIKKTVATDLAEKIKKINERQSDDLKKDAAETRAEIEKIASNPISFFFKTGESDFATAGAALAGAFDKALSGKSGAVQMISSLGGAFADEILPRIGGVVGSILSKLAAGPEQAKAFVKEFIAAIPDIIIAIVDALPEALSGLIEKVFSPEFLQRLGFAIGKSMLFVFTAGLNRFAPEWGQKIGEYILMPLKEGLAPIFERLAVVFQPFNDAANNLKTALEPVSSVMQNLADALNNFNPGSLGGGGGIGGAIGGFFGQVTNAVSSALGFSQGGIVPMYAADGAMVPRGTDTVPAMLTPGELVIPRDMVGELGAFLSAQNNTGGDGQAALLAAILSAVQAPIVVKTEAKVNQNAFADIILQLNRQNMRLAV